MASSKMDCGTLYQLHNVINRRNVGKDVTQNIAACEEFFNLIAESHISNNDYLQYEVH